MFDRASDSLRGCVAVCEQREEHWVATKSFRPDGALAELAHRNADGSGFSVVRHYSADGRVLVEEHTCSEPYSLTYSYDAQRRLARIDAVDSEGAEHVRESYLYHDDATRTVTRYVHPPLFDQQVQIVLEDTLHHALDAFCIMTVFDTSSRPFKRVMYDVGDRVIRRVLFRYDADGRLLEEGEVESGVRVRADMRNAYRYNAQGARIEAEMHWGDLAGQRLTMSYTDLGDLQEKRIVPLGPAGPYQGSAPWSQLFSYEYDSQGNWTSRSLQHRLDSGEITHTGLTRRTLTYWDSSNAAG